MSIAKTGCGCVPKTETDDTRWGREGIRGPHDRGGERIGRGRRPTGSYAAIRAALAILRAEVTGN
jgi:hypothetical protein